MNRYNRRIFVTLSGALCALLASVAFAQYPSKPIRIVVPFPPGGTTDIMARAVANDLQRAFGQPVIVDNKAGAGGNIGADAVAKAPPDGYTFVMGTVGTHAINVALYAKMPYDPVKDFAPVSLVAGVPNILVAAPAFPAHSVREVIDLAKKRGYNVIERHIRPEELTEVQEMFVTGTAAEITPVRAIDDLTYQLGPVTKQLIDDYHGLTRGHAKAA